MVTKPKSFGSTTGIVGLLNVSRQTSGDQIQQIERGLISPNPRQPRKHFDSDALAELAASIKEHSILQPLTVTADQVTDGRYWLIAGERRWRASAIAGLKTVPCIVREATMAQLAEWALIENIQRADLSAIEEAIAYQQLIDELGLTQEQVADKVGKSRSAVANKLRLLKLPADIQTAIADGKIEEAHGRELLRLIDSPSRLAEEFDNLTKNGWSKRQLSRSIQYAETFVREDMEAARQMKAAIAVLAAGWSPSLLGGKALPLERVHDGASHNLHEFDVSSSEGKALLERGICGVHCACCVIGRLRYGVESGLRPDPLNAPNVALGCNADCGVRQARRSELKGTIATQPLQPTAVEAEQVSEKKRRELLELENKAQAEVIWAVVAGLDRSVLWNDFRFWKVVAEGRALAAFSDVQGGSTIADLANFLIRTLHERCWRWTQNDGRLCDLDILRSIVAELQEICDSSATSMPAWLKGWGEEGEDEVWRWFEQEIGGDWDELAEQADDIQQERVLLRAIAECPDGVLVAWFENKLARLRLAEAFAGAVEAAKESD